MESRGEPIKTSGAEKHHALPFILVATDVHALEEAVDGGHELLHLARVPLRLGSSLGRWTKKAIKSFFSCVLTLNTFKTRSFSWLTKPPKASRPLEDGPELQLAAGSHSAPPRPEKSSHLYGS